MNDYNELIERCKEILEWKKTGLLNGDALREYANRRPDGSEYNKLAIAEAVTLKDAAEAFVELAARIAELESRLEISPLHNVDGIMARDATIKLQDEHIAELEAERAEREKQEPVRGAFLNNTGGVTLCQNGRERWSFGFSSMLYAAPPVTAPVRLTDLRVVDLFHAWNDTKGSSHADLIRSVETAVLRANGFKVEE